MAHAIKLEVLDPGGSDDYVTLEIPARWAICPKCCGEGHHEHPAFENGITMDEWNGPDWDEDSQEAYLSGAYDVQCSECSGSGKVLEADREMMTADQIAAYDAHLHEEREFAWLQEAERRMGA